MNVECASELQSDFHFELMQFNKNLMILVHFPLNEHFFCKEYQYLANLRDVSSSARTVRNLRSTKPVISFHIQCYHYETRYRTVSDTKTDANGKTYTETRTESYQERVNSHRANERYHFDHHEDDSSDNLDGINCEGVTRIRLIKGNILSQHLINS